MLVQTVFPYREVFVAAMHFSYEDMHGRVNRASPQRRVNFVLVDGRRRVAPDVVHDEVVWMYDVVQRGQWRIQRLHGSLISIWE